MGTGREVAGRSKRALAPMVAAVAVIVGGAALFIGYTAEQVAHAQEVKDAIDAGEL